jgi:FHS family Na+ dependent glucose MFS transporter 1
VIRRSVALYFASFLVMGLSLSVLGPALTQLRERSSTGIGGIGILFVGQSLGYVIGSFFAGRLLDRYRSHQVFAASFGVLAVGLALVPAFDALPALFSVFLVIGFGGASIDVGANTMIVWELRERVGRSMNALHMCFGIGAVTAPLFVHVGLTIATRSAAVLCVVLAGAALSIPGPAAPHSARHEHTDATPRLMLMLAVFFFLYVGLEIGFAGWIHTYGEEIQFSDLAATWLTTTFWLSFTVGRLLASAFANRISAQMLLASSCGLTIVAAVGLILGDGSNASVWIGTVAMGLATAPQFPAMLTYIERHVHVTGQATAWFVGGAGVGGLVFPWLIGRWFDATGATALPWAMLLLGSLTVASFATTHRVLSRSAERYST